MIHVHGRQDVGDRQGVGDVLVTRAPHLPVVCILGEGVGANDVGDLRFGEVLEKRQAQIIDGGGYGDSRSGRLRAKLVLKVAAPPVVWSCRLGGVAIPRCGRAIFRRGYATGVAFDSR